MSFKINFSEKSDELPAIILLKMRIRSWKQPPSGRSSHISFCWTRNHHRDKFLLFFYTRKPASGNGCIVFILIKPAFRQMTGMTKCILFNREFCDFIWFGNQRFKVFAKSPLLQQQTCYFYSRLLILNSFFVNLFSFHVSPELKIPQKIYKKGKLMKPHV